MQSYSEKLQNYYNNLRDKISRLRLFHIYKNKRSYM